MTDPELLRGPHVKELRRLAGEAIGRFGLIGDGDRILVGLSGGKDSFILLHLLHHFRTVAPIRFQIIAGTFDPGYPEFDAEGIAAYCRERDWEHHCVKLPMEQLLAERHLETAPCGLCSRLRRGKLYGLAGKLGCTKLALGQHLDDLVASFFMSVCRGQGIRTMAPLARPENPEHPVIIRPLALVPEKLLKETAECSDFPTAGICRYEKELDSGDRAYFRALTETIAARIPDFRSNFLNSLSRSLPDSLPLPGKKAPPAGK